MRRLLLPFGVTLILAGCRMPDVSPGFGGLSLQDQIREYEMFCRKHGGGLLRAQQHISLQGVPAADAMVPYLLGKKGDIPRSDALTIVHWVQLRGCSLKGTAADAALDLLRKDPKLPPEERMEVEEISKSIKDDSKIGAGFDTLGAGACGAQPLAAPADHTSGERDAGDTRS